MSIGSWIKKNIMGSGACPQEQKCIEILEEVLDNESTVADEEFLESHIKDCWKCYENYDLEKAIREAVKSKIANRSLPEGFMDQVRSEIHNHQ